MKTIFREVAKQVHPDLATDEADRRKREQLMSEANAAYQQGDIDALRRILDDYKSSPEFVKGEGVASDLVRVIRQIRQVTRRLSQIECEIATLIDSDVAKLRAKVEAAALEGRDLLSEMAQDLKRRVDLARHESEARCADRSNR